MPPDVQFMHNTNLVFPCPIELEEENLKLKQDNLKLSKKCQDLKSDFQKTEKNLNEQFQSVNDENLKLREEISISSKELLQVKSNQKLLEKEVNDLKQLKDMKKNQYSNELDQLQAEINAKIEKLKKNELNEDSVVQNDNEVHTNKRKAMDSQESETRENYAELPTRKMGPASKVFKNLNTKRSPAISATAKKQALFIQSSDGQNTFIVPKSENYEPNSGSVQVRRWPLIWGNTLKTFEGSIKIEPMK